MKKMLIVFVAMMIVTMVYSQKENGTVYVEHPYIKKTQELWKAFEKGDKETYSSMLAEKMVGIFNGNTKDVQKRDKNIEGLDWFAEQFENLEVVVDTPAFADAIEYEKGGVWVQDWLVIKGTHKKTGINLNLKEHHLYSFNDEGKITSIHYYFNNDVFEEIRNSQTTKENGKVYINHPHIISVRKLVNAYCNENIEGMIEYYNPKVVFTDASMKWGESNDLETTKKIWEERFEAYDEIEMTQVGYPDCVYYAKNDGYVVYSWWLHSAKSKADGKVTEFPIMLSHSFDIEGKIIRGMAYFSTNHFEQ